MVLFIHMIWNAYMPYLTLWDKILQNLAHLEANSHKIFQISQYFQTILQHILWRNKYKSHFVVFITSVLHLSKGFWLFWESSSDFCKNLTKFYQISLKNLLLSHKFQSTAYGMYGNGTWYKMSRNMTKPTKWVCAHQRLRSTWASAQSDQSLRCVQMPRVIWVLAGRTVTLSVLSCHGSNYHDVDSNLSNAKSK